MNQQAAKMITREETYTLAEWKFSTSSGPILYSKCKTRETCEAVRARLASATTDDPPAATSTETKELCDLCRYINTLHLPSHPDMTFAWNCLKVVHSSGFGIEFNALDALKLLNEKNYIPKVAIADAWRAARQDPKLPEPKIPESHRFDWTFTTSYKGSLIESSTKQALKEVSTSDRIDVSKLTSREPINFYEDLCLFEDELSDHGVSKLSVKIRVMRTNFFILLRFFLRVDEVMIRMNDTRLYWELGQDFLLREYVEREINDPRRLPTADLIDPVGLSERVPITYVRRDRLEYPK